MAGHVELDDVHARHTAFVADARDASLELHALLVADRRVLDVHREADGQLVRAEGVEEGVHDVGGTGAVRHRCREEGSVGGHTSHLSVSPFALENERYILVEPRYLSSYDDM